MRVLLAGILMLLPFNAQGQTPSVPCDECEATPSAEPAPPHATEQPLVPEDPVDNHALEPFKNPYAPTSATNFDPFAARLTPHPEVNDHSRQSGQQDNSGPIDAIYGHFGNPLFPDSIENRGETAHPYPMDSFTNLYGRNRPVQGGARH